MKNSMAARVTQALVVGGAIAVPDYVATPKQQAIATTALIAGGLGLIAYFNSVDEDPNNDPAIIADQLRQRLGDIGEPGGPESDHMAGDLGGPVRTWAVLGTGFLSVAAILQAERRFAKLLRNRGMAKPHTLIGLAAGIATYQAG